MKKLCVLFFILCAMPVVSQSSWIESNISRESNANSPKDVLPVVNKDTNELALF
ncbi:MAG: hypothetical protein QNK89_04595 [Lacinutrix sp.]|uniref:hypothetical protein n=1 Tax=Lacinutrix sp. TaxID=1937692 RepID=UPI0030B7BDD8